MARGGVEAIKIVGYRETHKSVRAVSKDLGKELNKSVKVVATETATDARDRAEGESKTLRKGARTIKGSASSTGAFITFGGPEAEYMAGAEFGGGAHGPGNPTPRGGHTTQFPRWRGAGATAGYAVFPTIRDREERNRELVEEQLAEFFASNNLT